MPIPRETGLTSKLSGVNKISGVFDTWVKKNSVIGEELSKTFNYNYTYTTLDKGLDKFKVTIYAYDGEGDTDWAEDESGNLLPHIRRVCTVRADLSGLQKILKVQSGSKGEAFWKGRCSINVYFGGTALKARVTWYEGVSNLHFIHKVLRFGCAFQDILREGPVSVIPNSVY